MLIKALRAHEFGAGENRIVKPQVPRPEFQPLDLASGVLVTKVDCRRFPEPHIISTLPAHIEDRSS